MEQNLLKNEMMAIEMPEDMKQRIVTNCYQELTMEKEKTSMNDRKNVGNMLWKKPLVAAAALALCLCLTGITALAATGRLQGFFKDITNWNGAITGTSYEQATEEIRVSAAVDGELLIVDVEFLIPETVPYSEFEQFGIGSYEVVDEAGIVVVEGKATEGF